MLRSSFAIGLMTLWSLSLRAQPDLGAFVVDPPHSTTFHSAACEVPPWILAGSGNWRSYFFVNGVGGYIGSAEGSIVSAADIFLQTGPAMITEPADNCARAIGQDWKRTYYAVYSAQYFDHPGQGPVTMGFLHAENKTRCDGGHVICQNSINVLHLRQSCPLGDDWERYNSFVCATWIPNTPGTNWGQQRFPNDLGPIVWPSTGYLQTNREKFSCGVNTPSSIQYNGYLYLFFHDDGPYGSPGTPPFYLPQQEEGRYEGIKVARAPLAGALDPRAWQVFYRDPAGVETWHPSLPEGFTKENMMQFLNQPGPKSTDIMGDEGNNLFGEIRFSVAQVRGSDYFIGVESYTDGTDPVPGTGPGTGRDQQFRVKKALRYSHDLIHWSDRKKIIETADDWSGSNLNYPVLLGSDGLSNNVVDSTDFYVLGTNSIFNTSVNKVHIHLPASYRGPLINATGNALLTDSLSGLTGVYPNPGKGRYRLSYTLGSNAGVQVTVFDWAGRELFTDATASSLPGHHVQDIDIARFGKGIFLMELLVDGRRHVYKVVNY